MRNRLTLFLTSLFILAGCNKTPTTDEGQQKPVVQSSSTIQSVPQQPTGSLPTTVPAAAAMPAERRVISFVNSKSETVPGYLWLPARASLTKLPAVMLMYGIKGNKDDATVAEAAKVLNASNIVGMTFDWPGTGARGNIGNQARIMNTNGVINATLADYADAYKYLQSQPEVDPNRLGFAGASMGAMTGALFVADNPYIKAMVAIVPIPNPAWSLLGGLADPQTKLTEISTRNRRILCMYTQNNSDMSAAACSGVTNRKAYAGDHELSAARPLILNDAKDFFLQNL